MWTILSAMAAGILLVHVLKWKISCLAMLLYMGEKGFQYPNDAEMREYTTKVICNILRDHKLK